MDDASDNPADGLVISSSAFKQGMPIPVEFSCRGQNINPPLDFSNIPTGAQSLALIMHDPDAPVGDYTHWLIWNLPADTKAIDKNSVPSGAIQGQNSSNQASYLGPCPPSGKHRYIFELYALDSSLGLSTGSNRDQLEDAIKDHVIGSASLTGTFAAETAN